MKTTETTIIAPEGATYLSDVFKDGYLPDNCRLNKVTTGSGLTSVALSNDRMMVIAMPYVTLIEDKMIWCTKGQAATATTKERLPIDALGVHGKGHNEDDIRAFTGKKIMCTYDSLGKVTAILKERGLLSKTKLVIDESHTLLLQASFRYGAMKTVIDSYDQYGSYLFATATPNKKDLIELDHIPKVRIKWSNLTAVAVDYTQCPTDLTKVVAKTLEGHLTGAIEGNAYVFINSLVTIGQIQKWLRALGHDLTMKVKVVCANKPSNATFLAELGLIISTPSSANRPITFVTSTAFEGVDFKDTTGHNYVVVDGHKTHTTVDIMVTLPQIIGRIRKGVNNHIVKLLYSSSKYISNLTLEQFTAATTAHITETQIKIDYYNNAPSNKEKDEQYENNRDNDFILYNPETHTFSPNSLIMQSEINAWHTVHSTFFISQQGSSICDGIMDVNGKAFHYKGQTPLPITGFAKAEFKLSVPFQDLCLEYIELELNTSLPVTERLDMLFKFRDINPLIAEAYLILGAEKMKALKYRKGNIKKALIVADAYNTNKTKIANLMNLKSGDFIASAFAKKKLQGIYDTLEIERKAKASDLSEIYQLNTASKRIKDVKVVGFTVVFRKVTK